MIEIDGSYGEGGGQILRTALALSVITKKPCYIFNIRKNRENSGLANQHLIGLQALASLCNAKVEGADIGSSEIIFEPNEIYLDKIEIKIETAASITLIFQILLWPILFGPHPVSIRFKGGATDTFFSPTIDYFQYVFLPMVEKIIVSLPKHKNGKFKVDILKRGFYPKGGAEVDNVVYPLGTFQKLTKPFYFTERGELKKILIISGAAESLKEEKVAQRQLNGAHQTPLFYKKAQLPIETRSEYYQSFSPESQMTIIGEFQKTIMGVSVLGKRKKSSEEVGQEAAMKFLKETRQEAVVDSRLADQILPAIALFLKSAKIKTSQITQHTKTNIWVIEKFLKGKFQIKDNIISWNS